MNKVYFTAMGTIRHLTFGFGDNIRAPQKGSYHFDQDPRDPEDEV